MEFHQAIVTDNFAAPAIEKSPFPDGSGTPLPVEVPQLEIQPGFDDHSGPGCWGPPYAEAPPVFDPDIEIILDFPGPGDFPWDETGNDQVQPATYGPDSIGEGSAGNDYVQTQGGAQGRSGDDTIWPSYGNDEIVVEEVFVPDMIL